MKDGQFYLGLDVGGSNLVAGVVDKDYRLIGKSERPTNAGRPMDEIIFDMVEVSMEAIRASGLEMSRISSWGIGMPSCINRKTNLLVHANCFGWKNVPIYDCLKGRLPLPVYIENDANCATYGEALAGAARGYKNVLMLTLGTGVGGGIIIDGKIYAGADNMGAELGHTKLVYDGELCTCGQKGCLEAYCSSTALRRIASQAMLEHPDSQMVRLCREYGTEVNGKVIFQAAKEGDDVAMKIVNDCIAHLAAGISTFITIFRPEIIVLGGGIAESGDFLLEPLNRAVGCCTFGASEIGVPPIVKARLGNDAGIIGAALLEKNSNLFNR